MVNIFEHTDDVAYLKSKGVYLITHTDTDIIYVGSTKNCFRTRWVHHLNGLYKENKTGNRVLINIANKYGADLEIVSLGALLHDIALVCKVGDRKDHHINGERLARKILDNNNYDSEKKERVLKCVYNHRSSKNAENIEGIHHVR